MYVGQIRDNISVILLSSSETEARLIMAWILLRMFASVHSTRSLLVDVSAKIRVGIVHVSSVFGRRIIVAIFSLVAVFAVAR